MMYQYIGRVIMLGAASTEEVRSSATNDDPVTGNFRPTSMLKKSKSTYTLELRYSMSDPRVRHYATAGNLPCAHFTEVEYR